MSDIPTVTKHKNATPTVQPRIEYEGLVPRKHVALGWGFPDASIVDKLMALPGFPQPVLREGFKCPMWNTYELAKWGSRPENQVILKRWLAKSRRYQAAKVEGRVKRTEAETLRDELARKDAEIAQLRAAQAAQVAQEAAAVPIEKMTPAQLREDILVRLARYEELDQH